MHQATITHSAPVPPPHPLGAPALALAWVHPTAALHPDEIGKTAQTEIALSLLAIDNALDRYHRRKINGADFANEIEEQHRDILAVMMRSFGEDGRGPALARR